MNYSIAIAFRISKPKDGVDQLKFLVIMETAKLRFMMEAITQAIRLFILQMHAKIELPTVHDGTCETQMNFLLQQTAYLPILKY